MASGDTKTNQYLDIAANGTRADLPGDTCCETRTQTLIRGVAERIMDIEDEVERLENNPDVVDIVATYADLQAYDTSQLTDKDVIRVLQDETRDGDSTYYRWSTATNTWTYIGESKQYTDFVGTDGTTAGEAGLVPAPATTDVDKFLKSDGTWADAGGGGGGEPDYSTSEVDTGTKWVDGKTIYKKTFAIPPLSSDEFSINLRIANLYRVVEVKGFLYSPYDQTGGVPLVSASTGDASNQTGVSISSGQLNIYSKGRRDWTGYATIYYTKSE